MVNQMRKPILLTLFSALLLASQAGAESVNNEQATLEKIDALKSQIAAVKKRISQREDERDTLQNRLAKTERAIGELDNALIAIEAKIDTERTRLRELQVEKARLEGLVGSQREVMATEVRDLWALQQGGSIRIIFGDQAPDQLARNLAFYQRVLNNHANAVTEFEKLINDVVANAEAIAAAERRLLAEQETLVQERAKADALQTERRQTLAEIQQQLVSDSARMARLEADRMQLTALLEELRQTLAELDTPSNYLPFAEQRRQLPYPVRTRPDNRFGAYRNSANMRWQGWLMPAPEGSSVRAIHFGRVVYADWLRGQGLLMVLDHGDGYLSLYGQNRSLQREIGDWVAPGDIIATVGASGGATRPALYFEIRHNGAPVDPGIWLTR